MKKLAILFVLLTSNAFAECNMKRPSWQAGYKGYSSTRHYVLYTQGQNTQTNSKNSVISGSWKCKYSNKVIVAQDKEEVRNKIEIDHVLPWSFFKKNAKNCDNAKEFFNDTSNLLAVDKKANRDKTDSIDYSGYDKSIQQIACNTCKKYSLDNCIRVC